MKKSLIWILSVIITLFAVIYQRYTGPTYPTVYQVAVDSSQVKVKLPRSHGGDTDKRIRIKTEGIELEGRIIYRRFPTTEPWDTVSMVIEDIYLTGYLPGQPPAGKLEYVVQFKAGNEIIQVNDQPVIIRFKGSVPGWVLIPHILFVFAAMLFSSVTGFFAIFKYSRYKSYAISTVVLLLVGGFILGPVVQKFAFGEFWTGFPFGKDLTDNKVLFALVFWLIAILGNLKKDRPALALTAALVYLVINFIPHSLLGSELNYDSGEVMTGMILPVIF